MNIFHDISWISWHKNYTNLQWRFLGLQRCTPIRHTRLLLGYGTWPYRGWILCSLERRVKKIKTYYWYTAIYMSCNKQHEISDLSKTRNSIFAFMRFGLFRNLSRPRYIEECQGVRLSLQAKNLFSALRCFVPSPEFISLHYSDPLSSCGRKHGSNLQAHGAFMQLL